MPRSFLPARPKPEAPPELLPSATDRIRKRIIFWNNRFRYVILTAACILVVASVLVYQIGKPTPQRLTQRDIDAAVTRSLEAVKPKPSVASQVFEIIRPSVVFIHAVLDNEEGKPVTALGTGVVVNENGLILTSLHIVETAKEIKVIFADGSDSLASVVTEQPEKDLAVLLPKVIPDDLVPATLADSRGLRPGDEVVVVGNPFGLPYSVSAGVVSGLDRSFKSRKTGKEITNLIQFDAAVNPGNSGGPLLNRDGEVVGIVAALVNPTEQEVFIGIGFAVPIETVTLFGPPIL